jgi:3-dehydroquinate synthase class II
MSQSTLPEETFEQIETRLKTTYEGRIRSETRLMSRDDYAAKKVQALTTAHETMRAKPEQGEPVNARELSKKDYANRKKAAIRGR